ncbi:hypothetical protein DKM44_03920 [Deinococcus irradiatisoli]|uniref:DUF4304 domain-containing protein n=1 Tax=Deinococcus irradiatisoli TaxID=2202254 RepID=A0A2Z3JH06_9DEIO|nr:hypothetical protein DKM44_03920 [Deinococcus irradiatisoli]
MSCISVTGAHESRPYRENSCLSSASRTLSESTRVALDCCHMAMFRCPPALSYAARHAGYQGSGQTMHATSDGFVWVLNVQRSHDGIHFYVNLGAHPLRLLQDSSSVSSLKEGECAFRTRVGERWLREPLDEKLGLVFSQTESVFRAEILAGVEQMPTTAPEDISIRGYHAEHHFLLFAQICEAYGQPQQALRLLEWGRPRVRPNATGLLQKVALFRQRLEG